VSSTTPTRSGKGKGCSSRSRMMRNEINSVRLPSLAAAQDCGKTDAALNLAEPGILYGVAPQLLTKNRRAKTKTDKRRPSAKGILGLPSQ